MPDPYKKGIVSLKNLKEVYYEKKQVEGKIVAVLNLKTPNRELNLISTASRAVKKSEIHELVGTPESAKPGEKVNSAYYIGFFEVTQGGVILSGDSVWINDKKIGTILGYDETHMPNHLNIVIKIEDLKTGAELGVEVGDNIIIRRD